VDSITTERNWLYGTNSNQYALVLQFIVRGQGGQLTLTPGMYIQAELVFFPSVTPLRAIIKRQVAASAVAEFSGMGHWEQVVQAETELVCIAACTGRAAIYCAAIDTGAV
jgi:hypothetical protein